MKLLSGIRVTFKKIKDIFKYYISVLNKKTSFSSHKVGYYFMFGFLLFLCSLFATSSVKAIAVNNLDYIAYSNEQTCKKNGTNIINYSFKNELEEKPMCDRFVFETFGIDVGQYSLDHSIYCYALLNGEQTGTISYADEIVTDAADIVFTSDLGHFFGMSNLLVSNPEIQYYSSLLRVSISAKVARMILNIGDNDVVDATKLSNKIIKLSYHEEKPIDCLIYSVVNDSNDYYRSLFKNELICIHDTEKMVKSFSRVVTLPSGRYRNSNVLKLFIDKGFSFDDFTTFLVSNKMSKVFIDNTILEEKIVAYKAICRFLLPSSIVVLLLVSFFVCRVRKDFINYFIFGFLYFILFEIIRYCCIEHFNNASLFMFLASSVIMFLCYICSFALVCFARKIRFKHDK